MKEDLSQAAKCWDNYSEQHAGKSEGLYWWDAGPVLHRHINRKISGDPEVGWIEYSIKKYLNNLAPSSGVYLSLGCGTGDIERSIARIKKFKWYDAFDISEKSIQKAQSLAESEGLRNSIDYKVADINNIILKADFYDAVWIHGAFHHFHALEHISEQIRKSLKPGGMLFLLEYIGPTRFQFSNRQKETINLCLRLLPAQYRRLVPSVISEQLREKKKRTPMRLISRGVEIIRNRELLDLIDRKIIMKFLNKASALEKNRVVFPALQTVIEADPSEAVRSGEIVSVLDNYFCTVEKKDWGGNIFQSLLSGIAGNFANESICSESLLRMIFTIEEALINCHEIESDYAYIAAHPKAE